MFSSWVCNEAFLLSSLAFCGSQTPLTVPTITTDGRWEMKHFIEMALPLWWLFFQFVPVSFFIILLKVKTHFKLSQARKQKTTATNDKSALYLLGQETRKTNPIFLHKHQKALRHTQLRNIETISTSWTFFTHCNQSNFFFLWPLQRKTRKQSPQQPGYSL